MSMLGECRALKIVPFSFCFMMEIKKVKDWIKHGVINLSKGSKNSFFYWQIVGKSEKHGNNNKMTLRFGYLLSSFWRPSFSNFDESTSLTLKTWFIVLLSRCIISLRFCDSNDEQNKVSRQFYEWIDDSKLF